MLPQRDLRDVKEGDLLSTVDMFGYRLAKLVDEQVRIKSTLETRWLEDLRQYEGRYDPETEALLKADSSRSSLFVNRTRQKVSAAEARLSEMLFPNDDRNYSLSPTPVPEMANEQAAATVDVDPQTGVPVTGKDISDATFQIAQQRAKRMQRIIDDQLTEARYPIVMRDVIHDAALLGTGIVKGPIVVGRSRKSWQPMSDASGATVHTLSMVRERRPGIKRVSPWDFFPDMSAACLSQADFTFEREFLTKRQLIKLIDRPGFIKEQIVKALQDDPRSFRTLTAHIDAMREISGLQGVTDSNKYEIWEYHGPVEREELEACGCEFESNGEAALATGMLEAVVTFVGMSVIRVMINPMDTEERPYSVLVWHKDESSIFGVGIPRQCKDAQKMCNSSWRMMADNAGLSSGPQIVIKRSKIEPADGNWGLKPRKLWLAADDVAVADVFAQFEISMHQQELINLFELSSRLVDEETGLHSIAEGTEGYDPQNKTLGGMSMLMNSANVSLRRVVKQFDDDVTVPLIARFYDFNMQYSDDENAKGDFEVDPRASSTLMVKEIQAQHLMMLAAQFAAHPIFGPMTKHAELYRKLVESMHLTPSDVVMTDDELGQLQQQAPQEQPQGEDPALKYQMHKENLDLKREIEGNRSALQIEGLRAKLADTQLKEETKRDLFASEKALKLATGQGI